MPTFKIYKLHFTAPLHIGDKRDEQDVSMKSIQSDTLIAAITDVLAKMGTPIPENGDLGCSVSSLFPFYQKDTKSGTTYFLPMPLPSRLPDLEDVGNAKKVKRVRWVDTALYHRILSGGNLFDKSDEYINNIHGDYLTKAAIPDKFMDSSVCQRVKIEDRTGQSDAVPYYVDRIIFADNAGFYFLATGDTTLLDKGMAMLQHEGLGTDRNVGYGFFEYTTDTLSIDAPAESDYAVSLSMLIPADKEQLDQLLAGDGTAYELTRRGGWITSEPHTTLRKNAIYAFLPGSVFRKPADTCGKIVDLAPAIVHASEHPHPIWRDGRAIMLPIKR